jgi:hypothetical protein
VSDEHEPPESVIDLAVRSVLSRAERSTAETFLDDRDWQLYNLIRSGDAQLAEDGESATFTREWVDNVWRNRRSVQYSKTPEDPFPGSVEEFVEGYFRGMLSWRDTLSKSKRAERAATKALRAEWRETGRMQLGSTLAGILRRSGQ